MLYLTKVGRNSRSMKKSTSEAPKTIRIGTETSQAAPPATAPEHAPSMAASVTVSFSARCESSQSFIDRSEPAMTPRHAAQRRMSPRMGSARTKPVMPPPIATAGKKRLGCTLRLLPRTLGWHGELELAHDGLEVLPRLALGFLLLWAWPEKIRRVVGGHHERLATIKLPLAA